MRGILNDVSFCMQGVGPNIVAGICLQAGIDPDLPVVQLRQEEWTILYEQWREWLLTISSGSFAPHLDTVSGSLSVLGGQRIHHSDLEAGDAQGSSAPTASVHALLDGALRSTQVQSPLCCMDLYRPPHSCIH